MRFENRVAVVTGAASGLGRAVAQRLASEGATIFGVDVNAEGLEETATLVREAGGTMHHCVANISDRMESHGAIAQAMDTCGRIDVLVNVAGVLRAGHVTDVTEETWNLVFGVNVAGTFWMCQAAIPHLLESHGNIVNVASNAGLMGTAYTTVYASSKAAVVNMTRSLAMEFIRTPLRINAVAPGGINTAMAQATFFPEDTNWKLVAPSMGFRSLSEPEEIAAVIAFVASPDAKALHGAIVSADEGITAS
jgi:NAD(P)-dependent dehydrogenase (short-subunit alcohol dehydrogenase family)